MNRRSVLIRIAAAAGVIGAALAAIPFIRYFAPSEKAKALGSPISIDLTGIGMGETRTFTWRGMPVMVVRRAIPNTSYCWRTARTSDVFRDRTWSRARA